ncbi:MAG: hypothetical protein V4649_12685 [Bacteroidota bacterium]
MDKHTKVNINTMAEFSAYSDEFKAELDSRYEEYKSGGKLISEEEANNRISTILGRLGNRAQAEVGNI